MPTLATMPREADILAKMIDDGIQFPVVNHGFVAYWCAINANPEADFTRNLICEWALRMWSNASLAYHELLHSGNDKYAALVPLMHAAVRARMEHYHHVDALHGPWVKRRREE